MPMSTILSEPSKEWQPGIEGTMIVRELVFQLKKGKLFDNEVLILDEEGNEYKPVLVEVEDEISYIKVELL